MAMHRPTNARNPDRPWPPLASGVLVLVALAFLAITGCSDPPVETRSTAGTPASRLVEATESVGLPPLPPYRAEVYDYYSLGFLDDGYPGRWTDEGLVPHPIYGTYVVIDHLNLFERTGDRRFLEAARRAGGAGRG